MASGRFATGVIAPCVESRLDAQLVGGHVPRVNRTIPLVLSLLFFAPACDDGGGDDEASLDEGGSTSGGEERSACIEAFECAETNCTDVWESYYAENCEESCPAGSCVGVCQDILQQRSECMDACAESDDLWAVALVCFDPETAPSECESATATCEAAE